MLSPDHEESSSDVFFLFFLNIRINRVLQLGEIISLSKSHGDGMVVLTLYFASRVCQRGCETFVNGLGPAEELVSMNI